MYVRRITLLKIKKIVSAFVISSLILLIITACAELDSHSPVYRFQKAEDAYRAGMRWGEWESVLYQIRPNPKTVVVTVDSTDEADNYIKEKTSRDELLTHLVTIKVTNAEALSSSMNEDEGTGETRMMIQYRFENSAKIQTIRYKVSWWHDEKSNTWFTETPLPKEFEPPKHKTIKLSPKRY